MGNEFQDAEAQVTWSFYAEQVANQGGGDSSGGDKDKGKDKDKDEPPVTPSVEEPEEIEVVEPDVPSTGPTDGTLEEIEVPVEEIPMAPKTGDETKALPFIILMVLSGTGLAALLLFGRRARPQ